MGSFYSTCSITDLSIVDGDEMYMQLLLPTWVTNPHSIDGEKIGCGEKGLRVSNEGPLGEWVPFGFPIEGHYADYGDIDGVKPSRNIQMLEEFFGIPIQSIIACATDDRWYKHSYKPMIEDKEKEEYKGQWKSWTVADNKMKHIGLLKKLTVTYFNKAHYDYLSTNRLGHDSYSIKERTTRMKTMIELLPELEKARPKSGNEKKNITLVDVTDELRKKYEVIKSMKGDDEDFDEMIVDMENYRTGSWWKREWDYKFYIPSIAKNDMFKLLPISPLDEDEIVKQYVFIINMMELYKVLRPSYYGSQQNNFDAYAEFHKFSTELVSKKKMEIKADTIAQEIGWILNDRLKGVSNKELADAIKNDIKEGLEEGYGITIKI